MKLHKRLLPLLSGAIALIIALSACGGSTGGQPTQAPSVQPTAAAPQYTQDFKTNTKAIDDLKQPCDQQGTLVSLEYETPAYAYDESVTLTKKVNIYLPYGYDESKDYNIVYLMHGGGENEDYWLVDQRFGQITCNVLDHMIQDGVCDPVLIVCPSYNVEGFTGEGEMNEELTSVFAKELRNNVVPAVEAVYPTYAKKDVSEANLIATRDHRAFAGFSMGSITTIHSAIMQNLDIFSYFGSYSGAKTDLDEFLAAVNSDQFKDYPIAFWFNGNGKGDISVDEHDEFAHGALEAMSGRLTDGENFAWINMRDGTHSYGSWIVDLYNSLLVFFK